MENFLEYTDKDNNDYILVKEDYIKNNHACHGCAFKFGNSKACQEAKTCTPKNDHKDGFSPRVIGRHVWKLKTHWLDKEK